MFFKSTSLAREEGSRISDEVDYVERKRNIKWGKR